MYCCIRHIASDVLYETYCIRCIVLLIFLDFQAWLGWLACLAGLACLADLAGLAWLGWLGWLGQFLSKKAQCSLCFHLFSIKNTKTYWFLVVVKKNTCLINRGTPNDRVELRPHERVLFHIEVRTLYAGRMFREIHKRPNTFVL